MLSYNVRDLEQQAVRVDGMLAADDPIWMAGDSLPATAVHATGRLSRAGAGHYYWSGWIKGTARVTCRRCLTDVDATVAEEVHVIFVEADDDIAEDPDTFRIPPGVLEVDLRPAVREQWLLSAPEYALCREDCKGLCPRCGADLNAGPCACPPELEVDSRWSALRAVRDQSK